MNNTMFDTPVPLFRYENIDARLKSLIYQVTKHVSNKVGIKDLAMEPDEAQIANLFRLEGNSMGTLDMRDPYLQIMKSQKILFAKKAVARRFVPGNTAFKVMSHVPILSQRRR